MYIKKLKIGNLELQNNIFLAPMAGITDLSFRKVYKEYGMGLIYTEMASSKALYYNDIKTDKLTQISENEHPIAIQIFGNDPEIMAYAAKKLSQNKADIIDINFGCPAPKIVKNGEGSKLMLNPKLVGEIVKSVTEASSVPVTAKIRKGWDEKNINAVEIAKICEENGSKAITVHGRTKEEFYSGKADWEIIKKVKDAVSIPVIGNGDITSEEDAKKMFETTNCDGIMIARGALGNPFIFSKIINYLEKGEKINNPTNEEIYNVIIKHYEYLLQEKQEEVAVKEMRKHVGWYIKGLENASKVREKINSEENYINVQKILKEYLINMNK